MMRTAAGLALTLVLTLGADAQRGPAAAADPRPWSGDMVPVGAAAADRAGVPPALQSLNVAYNGKYEITRIRYTANERGNYEFFGDRLQVWEHDYPRAERHMARILAEVTSIVPDLDASNIFFADDPNLDRFPYVYHCEAGFWGPTDKEVVGMRNFMLKGGFVIFDDFRGEDWENFIVQLGRVLPGIRPIQLDVTHPIFHVFFDVKELPTVAPTFRRYPPIFYGLFENNDPKGRMMAIVDYNNDVSEYWEWSGTGMFALDLTNEAYKLGANYVIYAMTH